MVNVQLDWLKKWAMFSPHKSALKEVGSNKSFSYFEFYNSSMALAEYLKAEFDLNVGDRVAVLSTNEFEYVVLFYALQRIGAIMVPVNCRLTANEIKHILSDSSPKLVIHQEVFRNTVSETGFKCHQLTMEAVSDFVSTQKCPSKVVEYDSQIDSETACMILYTSGTTGSPKGALVHHGMLFWNSVNTSLRLNISQNDKTLIFMPFFHTGGWNVLTTPFFHRGAEIILMRKFDPKLALKVVEAEKLTILFAVPTMMQMMADENEFGITKFKSVRYAIVGGEPSSLELIQKWNAKGVPFRQGYGLTEFGPNVFSLNEEDSQTKLGSIGFANFYIDVKIINKTGDDCVPGEVGELILKGPMCTKGYWNNLSATSDAIKDGWFHTGDLVKKDEHGFFYVVGRKKEMYISGGENVYPIEVEHVLKRHPHVKEVAVVGVPDEKWGEVGKAFIVPIHQNIDLDHVKNFCSGNLAKFKIPKHFHLIQALPKGDSGKILKKALLNFT